VSDTTLFPYIPRHVYIPSNAAALWREFALRPGGCFVANIFGTGTCFIPAFLLVAVAVLPVTWAAKNLVTGKRLIAAVAIFILFAAGACGRSRVSTGIVSSEAAPAPFLSSKLFRFASEGFVR